MVKIPRDRQPVNAYIEKIVRLRNENAEGYDQVIEGELPKETEKRLIGVWNLPKSYEEYLLKGKLPLVYLKAASSHHLISAIASKLEKSFLPLYEEITFEIFIQELKFILGLYMEIKPLPTKNELKSAVKPVQNEVKKAIGILYDYFAPLHEKPESFYIADALSKSSHVLLSNNYDNVLSTIIEWHESYDHIDMELDSLIDNYKANGRQTLNRNNALIALASSYECCFGFPPTRAKPENRPSFFMCAYEFIQKTEQDHALSDATFDELMKDTIREYNNRFKKG